MTQKVQFVSVIGIISCLVIGIVYGFSAPSPFLQAKRFEVQEGESVHAISIHLEEDNIIGSALLFRAWVSLLGKDTRIGLGVYTFDKATPLPGVIAKLISGPDEPLLSVTIPEGYTTKEIADAFAKALPSFSVDTFGEIAQRDKLDGYLFPSTYYPLPSSTEEDIVRMMHETFEKEYMKQFASSSFPRYVPTKQAVISLAAILEGEAKSQEDMKIVSGILQKRLEKGMRLQVDVAEVTYKETGIPDQPINNPGTVAIDAVFHPTTTKYLYYLTGKDGRMHYATTFNEHKRNIQKYLK